MGFESQPPAEKPERGRPGRRANRRGVRGALAALGIATVATSATAEDGTANSVTSVDQGPRIEASESGYASDATEHIQGWRDSLEKARLSTMNSIREIEADDMTPEKVRELTASLKALAVQLNRADTFLDNSGVNIQTGTFETPSQFGKEFNDQIKDNATAQAEAAAFTEDIKRIVPELQSELMDKVNTIIEQAKAVGIDTSELTLAADVTDKILGVSDAALIFAVAARRDGGAGLEQGIFRDRGKLPPELAASLDVIEAELKANPVEYISSGKDLEDVVAEMQELNKNMRAGNVDDAADADKSSLVGEVEKAAAQIEADQAALKAARAAEAAAEREAERAKLDKIVERAKQSPTGSAEKLGVPSEADATKAEGALDEVLAEGDRTFEDQMKVLDEMIGAAKGGRGVTSEQPEAVAETGNALLSNPFAGLNGRQILETSNDVFDNLIDSLQELARNADSYDAAQREQIVKTAQGILNSLDGVETESSKKISLDLVATFANLLIKDFEKIK